MSWKSQLIWTKNKFGCGSKPLLIWRDFLSFFLTFLSFLAFG